MFCRTYVHNDRMQFYTLTGGSFVCGYRMTNWVRLSAEAEVTIPVLSLRTCWNLGCGGVTVVLHQDQLIWFHSWSAFSSSRAKMTLMLQRKWTTNLFLLLCCFVFLQKECLSFFAIPVLHQNVLQQQQQKNPSSLSVTSSESLSYGALRRKLRRNERLNCVVREARLLWQ